MMASHLGATSVRRLRLPSNHFHIRLGGIVVFFKRIHTTWLRCLHSAMALAVPKPCLMFHCFCLDVETRTFCFFYFPIPPKTSSRPSPVLDCWFQILTSEGVA